MNKDKKRTTIFAALALVLLGVGAFQFIGGSAEPKPTKKAAATKKESKKDKEPKAATEVEGVTTVTVTEMTPEGMIRRVQKVDASGKVLEEQIQDADGNVITEAAITAAGETSEPGVTSPSAMGQTASANLPVRDPFQPPQSYTDANAPSRPSQQAPTPKPIVRTAPGGRGAAGVAASTVDQVRPLPPMGLDGELPPVSPQGPIAGNTKPNNENLRPSAPLRTEDEVAATPVGVVLGDHPVAVFKDDSGNQRAVRVGGTVAGARVIEVGRGYVVVEHKGKRKKLKVGGGSEN